jgi:DNA replication protein DnaC
MEKIQFPKFLENYKPQKEELFCSECRGLTSIDEFPVCKSCSIKIYGDKEDMEKAIKEYPLNDNNSKTFEVCKNFKESSRGIYLYGDIGHGKSLVVRTIWRYTGSNSPFIKIPMLLKEIRNSYDGEGKTETQIINSLLTHKIIFLDDFAAEKVSGFTMETLYVIFCELEERNIRPFITSNLDLKELAKIFCDRLISRICGMCKIVNLNDKDHRLEVTDEIDEQI